MLLILLQPTCFKSVALFSRVPYLKKYPGFKACGRPATGNLHAANLPNRVNTEIRKMNHMVCSMSGETQRSDKENALCCTKDYDKLFNNRRIANA
jgi:hypothetical protein